MTHFHTDDFQLNTTETVIYTAKVENGHDKEWTTNGSRQQCILGRKNIKPQIEYPNHRCWCSPYHAV